MLHLFGGKTLPAQLGGQGLHVGLGLCPRLHDHLLMLMFLRFLLGPQDAFGGQVRLFKRHFKKFVFLDAAGEQGIRHERNDAGHLLRPDFLGDKRLRTGGDDLVVALDLLARAPLHVEAVHRADERRGHILVKVLHTVLEQDVRCPHEHGQAGRRLARAGHAPVPGVEARRADFVGALLPELHLRQVLLNAGRHHSDAQGLVDVHPGLVEQQDTARRNVQRVFPLGQRLHVHAEQRAGTPRRIVLRRAHGGVDARLRRPQPVRDAFGPKRRFVTLAGIEKEGDVHAFKRIDRRLDDGVAEHPHTGGKHTVQVGVLNRASGIPKFLPGEIAPPFVDAEPLVHDRAEVAVGVVQIPLLRFVGRQRGVAVFMLLEIPLDG